MSLVSYEPWGFLDKFQRQLNHLAYSGELFANYDNDSLNMYTSGWRPAVDIKEEKNCFLIVADVPGINPKDIEITMENGVLTVKGERHLDAEDSDENYKRVERMNGTFYRRFSLPDTADGERIEAKGSNGVLEITIPKHEKVLPRRIEVKS
jgi:HSP20 family protein